MKMTFEVDGRVKFIYDDTLAAVATEIGRVSVARASHVEPACQFFHDVRDGWAADMGPVGGPILGPFATREEALLAERVWLVANDLPRPK